MYHKSQSLAEIGKHKQALSLLRKIANKEQIHEHEHGNKLMSLKEKITKDIHFKKLRNEQIYQKFIQNL